MPVCISAAVKSRNEVSPQGNADVPSRTTAGGFKICFLICSCKFEIRNRAPVLMALLRLPLASSRDSGTVSIAVLDRDCVQLSRSTRISLN